MPERRETADSFTHIAPAAARGAHATPSFRCRYCGWAGNFAASQQAGRYPQGFAKNQHPWLMWESSAVPKTHALRLYKLQDLCKHKRFTQEALAKNTNVSLTQMARYETKGIHPPADVLMKLAAIFGTTVDFLVNGATEDKAKAQLKDAELLQQFKDVEQLNEKDKSTIKDIIDAFIKRSKLKNIAAL